jgi:hypothetical protein
MSNLQTEDSKQQINSKIQLKEKSTISIDQKDSSETDYRYRFYPKGIFNISTDGTIKGEFDSISLAGKASASAKSQVLIESQARQDQQVASIKNASMLNELQKRNSEKITKSGGKWIVIFLLIIILAIFYMLKQKKKL